MRPPRQILIVEDEPSLREMLSEQFQVYEEFCIHEAASGSAALDCVKSQQLDLLLLDVGLQDFDGRELCKLIRRAGHKMPIIMLTAADTDSDTILGLDAGANDYITKPFRFSVLLARVRAQLRQHEQSEYADLPIGHHTLRIGSRLLLDTKTNQKIRLTEKEIAILKRLFQSGGKMVSRKVLLDEVWGYHAEVTTHTLETHIYRLRRKIERDPSDAKLLVTESGGYRLAI